ncbi:glycosyltransferase family 61 protein [Tianweitania sediminis]|uniref:Glycosyltransferase family 61 protein n=2 Tax=Tianweitania sediminis TaxID=1502156 RepID=A0A8J7RSS3_9HYPH|nr:glycosyltransferase family 61 protein [Tianweitania sediminis]
MPWTERSIEFGPTLARRLHGVDVARGYIVSDVKHIYLDTTITALVTSEPGRLLAFAKNLSEQAASASEVSTFVEEPVIFVCNEGSGTWGHWVVHNLPTLIMLGDKFRDARIAIPQAYFGSRPSFLESLLFLRPTFASRLLPIRSEVTYRFDTLLTSDFLYQDRSIHPEALKILESAGSVPTTVDVFSRVFLKRVTPGKREVANLEAVERILLENGYSISEVGKSSFASQLQLWHDASHVCAVLGSDLTNIVFAKSKMQILSITPEWFSDHFFFDLAAAKGAIWSEVFCGEMIDEKTPLHTSSFRVDQFTLQEMILSMRNRETSPV